MITNVAPRFTPSVQEMALQMRKYLSEASHQYLGRDAILLPAAKEAAKETKVAKYAYLSPCEPIYTSPAPEKTAQIIDFRF